VDDLTPGWKTVFRGVSSARINGVNLSGTDLHRMFATDDNPYYSTTCMYGDGTYSASQYSTANQFGNTVIEMGIDPKAKVAVIGTPRLGFTKDPNMPTQSQLDDALQEIARSIIANELDPGSDESSREVLQKARDLISNLPISAPGGETLSSLYALAGYDAIEVNGSMGVSYFVVLNRGILQVKKKDIGM
jgi:hypothetical protein